MPLREAIAFLKGAAPTQQARYVFHDGVAYVQSTAILAAYPIPHVLGTFGLDAGELEAALGRMSSEPLVEPAEGRLALRCGRLRSSIDLFATEPPGAVATEEMGWTEPPEGLIPAMAIVLPFASKEGTWQRSVELKPGLVRCVSGPHVCLREVDELEVNNPTALTDDSADWLASLPVKPKTWARDVGALWFRWPSGAWARCQLSSREWPAVVERVFEGSTADCPIAVTDEWREAFADCKALGEGVVDISPDRMVARSPHGVHEEEFPTGVARDTRWQLATLAHVLAVAEAWDPDAAADRRPAAFRGPRLRGVAMGMTR